MLIIDVDLQEPLTAPAATDDASTAQPQVCSYIIIDYTVDAPVIDSFFTICATPGNHPDCSAVTLCWRAKSHLPHMGGRCRHSCLVAEKVLKTIEPK